MTTVYDDKQISTVYLTPSPKTRPIRYIESIEKAGMIIDQKHAIAMYVSKSSSSQGIAGPPGATGATGPAGTPGTPGAAAEPAFDTIICSCSDQETPLTVSLTNAKNTFRAPYPFDMTNGYVRINVALPPLSSPLIVDLKMNGTSVFTTKVQIDASQKTSVTSVVPAVYNFPGNLVPDDAEFTVFVTAIGSGYAGAGLKIAVTGQKVPI